MQDFGLKDLAAGGKRFPPVEGIDCSIRSSAPRLWGKTRLTGPPGHSDATHLPPTSEMSRFSGTELGWSPYVYAHLAVRSLISSSMGRRPSKTLGHESMEEKGVDGEEKVHLSSGCIVLLLLVRV